MVMATPTPSPQQVGREFVRQYYTVLHEAPDVLHRFYSSGSTFVHGGVDRPGLTEEPVTGQLEIDKKIKLLNFKDCHTKIRQVDSQSTIGNGVVVQVTGELSNNGEPMRRFMQTFVLAPQTPKKFYVHNDIFRYQDEVYQDNSDTESEDPQQSETINKNQTTTGMNYYQGNEQQIETNEANVVINPTTTNNTLASSLSTSVTSSSSSSSTSSSSSATVSTSPSSQVVLQVEPVTLNQPVEVTEPQQTVPVRETTPGLVNGHGPAAVNESANQSDETTPTSSTTVVQTEVPDSVKEKPTVDKKVSVGKEELSNKQEPVTETKSSVGHSWAKIISTTSSTSNMEQPTLTGANPQVYSQNQVNSGNVNSSNANNSQQKRVNGNSSNFNNASSKGQQNKPRNQQASQQQQQQQQSQQSQQTSQQQQQQQKQAVPSQDQQSKQQRADLDDEKRFGRYPDGQQVFVGNLNQDLSETELRNYFGQFGKVIDVRINTNSKQQSGRRLPNYGFVVFDDKQCVEKLLSSSKLNSLTYVNDKNVEYRLNVEEKRARQGRMSTGFGGGKSNRATRSSSNGSRNGPNGHGNTNQKKNNNTNNNNNYSQSNDNNGPVSGSNGGTSSGGFSERRKTDVHENQMNENGGNGHRKSNIRRT